MDGARFRRRQRLQPGARGLRLRSRGTERSVPGGLRGWRFAGSAASPGKVGTPRVCHRPIPTSPRQQRGNIRGNSPRNFTTCWISPQKDAENEEGFGEGVRFGKLCLTRCCVHAPWTVCHLWRTLSCSQTSASPLCCSSLPNAGVKSHLCHAAVVPTPAFVRGRLGDAWEKKKKKG